MTVRRTTVAAGVLVAALVAGAGPATAGTATSPEERLEQVTARLAATGSAAAQGTAAALDAQLTSGETLGPGEELVSPNGRYGLRLDPDGSLVHVLRPTRFNAAAVELAYLAGGQPGARLVMQTDGNLVMYDPDGSVAENFGTRGSGADRLAVQDDRNVVLYGTGGVVINFDTIPLELLGPGQALLSGDRMVTADRRSVLVMQADGNLVLYQDGRVRFQSGTRSPANAGADAVMQADGNFVVYAGSRAVWSSRSGGRPAEQTLLFLEPGAFSVVELGLDQLRSLYGSAWGSASVTAGQSLLPGDRRQSSASNVLRVQTDGNIVQYVGGRAVWQTRTSGRDVIAAAMQEDGNFVVYGIAGDDVVPLFQTGTGGNPGASLVVPPGTERVQVRSRTGSVLYPR